jgi:glycosyltransferase involved in cell wall biosynthesis
VSHTIVFVPFTLNCREVSLCLDTRPELYGVHLKLHPGIGYSHPGACASPPPQLTPLEGHILSFNFRSATADWAYPLDLCACVYRASDVHHLAAVVKARLGPGALKNPNVLEVSGNEMMTTSFPHFTLGGCLSRPVCSVVTVNIVQCTYEVPIYSAEGGDLATLNGHLLPLVTGEADCPAVEFDYRRYKSSNYISVHIRDLYLLTAPFPAATAHTSTKEINVSVVLPILNGVRFIPRCLQSLLRQTYANFEVICVLNGCTDESEAVCSSFINRFAERQVCLTVLVREERGLVAALRAGLTAAGAGAGAGYICRMDVDDVMSSPSRLAHQVEYLETHPRIHVLGTQSFLSGDPSLEQGEAGAGDSEHQSAPVGGVEGTSVAAGIPTHPVLVQWEMMFRCVLLHPTVMFRKDVIAACGSYGNHLHLPTTCAEDYVLWAQVLQRHPFSIANLAHVDMCLYQHANSKSVCERESARVENIHIQWFLAKPLLSRREDFSSSPSAEGEAFSLFSKMSNPELIASLAEVKAVCRMIHSLHEGFVASIPPEWLGEDLDLDLLACLLKQSKIKIATVFLSKCVLKFSVDAFTDELSMLEINPATLLKYQLLGGG